MKPYNIVNALALFDWAYDFRCSNTLHQKLSGKWILLQFFKHNFILVFDGFGDILPRFKTLELFCFLIIPSHNSFEIFSFLLTIISFLELLEVEFTKIELHNIRHQNRPGS